MTDTPAPVPEEEAITQWLAAQQKDLADGVASFLDMEAGLREVEIYARHNDLVHGLGQVLDVEAGLAAILPPVLPAGSATGNAQDAARQRLDRAIKALPLMTRLTLRKHPAVMISIFGGLLARAVELTAGLARDRDRERSPFVPDPDLARAFNRAHVLARDLARDLARARDLSLGRGRDLEGDLSRAQDLTTAFNRADVLALDLTDALLSADVLALGLTDALTVALDLAHDLDVAPIRARDLALTLDRARDLAFTLDRDLVCGPNPDLAPGLARDLAACLDQGVGRSLGLEGAEGLSGALLDGGLDDFTRADLRGLDLVGIELAGVRWSSDTRWPQEIDREWLRSVSDEMPPGSGIFTVRPLTGTAGVQGNSIAPSQ